MSLIKAGVCRAFVVLFVFVLLVAAAPMSEESPPSWFWGCWVVTKSLPTAGISGISEKQADGIIGTRITSRPRVLARVVVSSIPRNIPSGSYRRGTFSSAAIFH
jgi:hypothetical protein